MSEGWPSSAAGREALLAPLAALPLPGRLGAPVVFGRGPFVLARLVIASARLLALHAGLAAALDPLATDLVAPGRWTPHVTLGRRLDAAQVAAALGLLGPEPGEVVLVGARHWDSVARLDEPLPAG